MVAPRVGAARSRFVFDRRWDLFGPNLDQIWTTAAQLTTTDDNSRQLIKSGVIKGNMTQAIEMSCG